MSRRRSPVPAAILLAPLVLALVLGGAWLDLRLRARDGAAPARPAPDARSAAGGPERDGAAATGPERASAGAVDDGMVPADPTLPATAETAGTTAEESPGGAATTGDTASLPLHPFLPSGGRARVVVLDPGHGGPEVGAAGAGLAEKDVNLRIARTLKAMLEEDGMVVVLTREGDGRASFPVPDADLRQPTTPTRMDLQARIDIANAARADVFISIHNNGSPDPGQSGTEVWWDGRRPWAAYNRALAEQVLGALVAAIRGAGYPVVNRGLQEDSNFRVRGGRSFPIFVLGPPRAGAVTTRATRMPAVLGETLFLSNPADAQQLTRDEMLTAIARGYREGLRRYFRLIDEGALALPPEGLPPEMPNFFATPPTFGPETGQGAR
jgi:N-acetylmuramoyl-L-alanine amidase